MTNVQIRSPRMMAVDVIHSIPSLDHEECGLVMGGKINGE